MSFLSGLFKNPLGTLAKTVTKPFQSLANVATGKGNLGDVWNLGSVFLPGGNIANASFKDLALNNFGTASILGAAGIRDPKNMNYMDYIKLANGFSGGGAPQVSQDDLTGMLRQGAASDAYNAQLSSPLRFRAAMQGYQALAPESVMNTAVRNRAMLMRNAASGGAMNAARLRGRGYAPSIQAGAVQQANNDAVRQGNQGFADLYSPESVARRSAMQADILNPNNYASTIGLYNTQRAGDASQRMSDAAYRQANPTFLDTITGIATATAPYWLDELFKKDGGSSNYDLMHETGGYA